MGLVLHTVTNTNTMADWKHGICGCFDNCDTCVFGYFCHCCMNMQSADRLGENKWLFGLMTIFVPCIAYTLLRGKAREKYGIEGSTMEDVGMVCCCGGLSNCQVANEIKAQGDWEN